MVLHEFEIETGLDGSLSNGLPALDPDTDTRTTSFATTPGVFTVAAIVATSAPAASTATAIVCLCISG